jgi:BirA family biotin operon repressor/biotin-[acetyl-CoA-carboxylase] ligase
MSRLDEYVLRQCIHADTEQKLYDLQLFAEIDSTNTYLMQVPAPPTGRMRVAIADHQTAGRGRRNRRWESPAGAGLWMSCAYTFAEPPRNLPALTLAAGIGAIEALQKLGIEGIMLKWPNDLVLSDSKLGGILTEVQQQGDAALTVIAGLGLNLDLPDDFEIGGDSEWAGRVASLVQAVSELGATEVLAAAIIDGMCASFVEYEQAGFAAFADRWPATDWLAGRELSVDTGEQVLQGKGCGIADDGALLLTSSDGATERVVSGSIVLRESIVTTS